MTRVDIVRAMTMIRKLLGDLKTSECILYTLVIRMKFYRCIIHSISDFFRSTRPFKHY